MRYLLTFLVLAALACRNHSADKPDSEGLILTVAHQAALRGQPGEQSKPLRLLQPNERLRDLDRVSDFETMIQFGTTAAQPSPWVEVETLSDHVRGFVPATALRPTTPGLEYTAWLLHHRRHCILGEALASRRDHWVETAGKVRSDSAFALVYREGMLLRKAMDLALTKRSIPQGSEAPVDYSWLDGAMPGFVLQGKAGQAAPGLFADYRYFQKIAQGTAGTQDDAFVKICQFAFSRDSIESERPIWVFPVSLSESRSNLGEGNHLNMLRVIDLGMKQAPLFQAELTGLKNMVLEDILGKDRQYWQPLEKIMAEMQAILAAPLPILDERDRLALETRMNAFVDPNASGIMVNLRAGQ